MRKTALHVLALCIAVLLLIHGCGGRREAVARARAAASHLRLQRDSLVEAVEEHGREGAAMMMRHIKCTAVTRCHAFGCAYRHPIRNSQLVARYGHLGASSGRLEGAIGRLEAAKRRTRDCNSSLRRSGPAWRSSGGPNPSLETPRSCCETFVQGLNTAIRSSRTFIRSFEIVARNGDLASHRFGPPGRGCWIVLRGFYRHTLT